jgi:hypothetical protein
VHGIGVVFIVHMGKGSFGHILYIFIDKVIQFCV